MKALPYLGLLGALLLTSPARAQVPPPTSDNRPGTAQAPSQPNQPTAMPQISAPTQKPMQANKEREKAQENLAKEREKAARDEQKARQRGQN
ncbi:hypothetical protein [Hymenobacter sp. CRA2]|uniref:hypothetical protein n=1 Tax=Hymenobacter sp. CRA2 TaxID=1955620 RepID=UPI00098EBD37|nr:hypothetical protein [Hymenobacter sp. CRA2]OON70706.1 hypothetical protein B0919_01435 [Hymenobacter sp. CRA2]